MRIEIAKAFGLSASGVFECDLESPEGQAALAHLTSTTRLGNVAGTPLAAFVEYLHDCRSVADVREVHGTDSRPPVGSFVAS